MQLNLLFCCVATAALVVSCGESVPESSAGANAPDARSCGPGSYVTAELYGALSGSLDWRANLACEGMPRPAGQGARLRLSGPAPVDEDQQLALILGIRGLKRGATGDGLQTHVTLIAEDQGLFFSTTDAANCWSDIAEHAAIDGSVDAFRISGVLYCVAALPEINGSKSITLGELAFATTLNWKAPE